MLQKEIEKIKKCLRHCNGGDCENCKALGTACDASWKFHNKALSLINELTEENERLSNRVVAKIVIDEKKLEEIKNECLSRSDSSYAGYFLGENDLGLMRKLAKGGSSHAKYRRMITVYVDCTAPLYWWKEYDTYKVGTVANSCSTMHKIHAKKFELDDFSHERMREPGRQMLEATIDLLNYDRNMFIVTKDKVYWDEMIQLLPTSYNQKRTLMLNYEVLTNIYHDRKNHKLVEWHTVCDWIEKLPYSELITG